MALALGVEDLEEIAGRIEGLLSTRVPESLLGKLALLPRLVELTATRRGRSAGAVPGGGGNGDQVDLGRLPVLTCWPQDGGPYFTLPLVITSIPGTGCATSACTACRSIDATPPACTGTSTRAGRSTTERRAGWGDGWRWRWPSAATRP